MLEIFSAIAALPKIFDFMKEFNTYMKSMFGDNWQKFVADSHEVFKALNQAKTPQEKEKVGEKLQDLLKRL